MRAKKKGSNQSSLGCWRGASRRAEQVDARAGSACSDAARHDCLVLPRVFALNDSRWNRSAASRVHSPRKLDETCPSAVPPPPPPSSQPPSFPPREGLRGVMMLVSHQVFAIDRWRLRLTVITDHRSTLRFKYYLCY